MSAYAISWPKQIRLSTIFLMVQKLLCFVALLTTLQRFLAVKQNSRKQQSLWENKLWENIWLVVGRKWLQAESFQHNLQIKLVCRQSGTDLFTNLFHWSCQTIFGSCGSPWEFWAAGKSSKTFSRKSLTVPEFPCLYTLIRRNIMKHYSTVTHILTRSFGCNIFVHYVAYNIDSVPLYQYFTYRSTLNGNPYLHTLRN